MSDPGPAADPNYRYSVNQYTGDGNRTQWPVSFAGGFISRDHVKAATVSGNALSAALAYAWVDDETVSINPPVPDGQVFRIYRDTPKDGSLVDFSGTSFFKGSDLDLADRQAVLLAAEALDAAAAAVQGPVGPQGPQGLGPTLGFLVDNFRHAGDLNDTESFQRAQAAIQAFGGGILEMTPGKTYIVGQQTFQAGVPYAGDIPAYGYQAWRPAKIMQFSGLRSLIIRGNGARLRCADELRYGTFDTTTGQPNNHGDGWGGYDMATPYEAMIQATNCASVEIDNLELDGNCEALIWGGPRGDTGTQINGSGLLIQQCPKVVLTNVDAHHHPYDGLQFEANGSFITVGCSFEFNCRLGGNMRGGSGFTSIRTSYENNGKGTHYSSPASGFDLEDEINGEPILQAGFYDCKFRNNRHSGMISDTGGYSDIRGVSFNNCLFVAGAADDYAFYTTRRGFKFIDCVVVGRFHIGVSAFPSMEYPYFLRTLFTDDPTWGSLSGDANAGQSEIIINDNARNDMFALCEFFYATSKFPSSPGNVGYYACSLTSANTDYGLISGTYRRCTITKQGVDLGSSSSAVFEDDATLVNGARQPKSVGMVRAGHVNDLSANPTQADFNNLLAALRAANLMA